MATSAGFPYQIVLFDFEGTLVDFQWDLQNAVREAREAVLRMGFPITPTSNDYSLLRNYAVITANERGLDKQFVTRCIDEVYDRYDADALTRWSLQPGVPGLLRDLCLRQVRTGLVTNIGANAIRKALARFELAEYIGAVVTRNDVELLKPSGEGIRTALRMLGGGESASLFVGDSVTDIRAARDAGVPVAIVLGGESAPESLAAASPDLYLRSISELSSRVGR